MMDFKPAICAVWLNLAESFILFQTSTIKLFTAAIYGFS
jgi:hypothetical protein